MEKISKEKVVIRISQIRKHTHLSRRSFCEKHGFSVSTFRDWENGKSFPSEKNILLIMDAFRKEGYVCSKKWILTGKGIDPIKEKERHPKAFNAEELSHDVKKAIENNKKFSLNKQLYEAVKANRKHEINDLISLGADLHLASNTDLHPFDNSENSLAHIAIEIGSLDMLKFLLEKGISLNVINRRKEGLLHTATLKRHEDIIKYLLKNGVYVDSIEGEGDTALGWAAYLGQVEAAHLLISEGANINHKNKLGNTPLHWAAYKGYISIVRLLVQKGAKISEKNNDNETSLDIAIKLGNIEVTKLLRIELGLNP